MHSPYKLSTLSSGWPIATVHLPHSESAAVGILIPVGSRHESIKEEGIAHFLEHMLFKGTVSRSAKEIVAEIEGHGGTVNAWTTEDHTFYEARGPEDILKTMIEVLSDMYFNSTFLQEEIERERGVICEEIVMYQENPGEHINDLMSASCWTGHELGKPIAGSIDSVTAISQEQMRQFIERNYYSNKTLFSIAAPQTHREMIDLCEAATTGKNASENAPVCNPFSNTAASPSKIVQHADIEQVHLGISFLTEGFMSPQRHSLRVFSTLFGETMSSRLFQRLREEAGVCYHIQTDLSLFQDSGSFSISAGLDADQLQASLAMIREELKNILKHGPGNDEIEQAKRFIIGQHRISFETSTAQMNWAASSLFTHGEIVDPKRSRDHIRTVTRADIMDTLESILKIDHAGIAAIGPMETSQLSLV